MGVQEVVIVSTVRTAIGRFGGALRTVEAPELAAAVVREVVDRVNIDPSQVDEVIMGHTYVSGEAPNVARQALLLADFPVEVPAYGVERQCGTGLQAICDATMQVQTGNARIVVAGGVESMSNMEYYVTGARWGTRMGDQVFCDRWDRTSENISTHKHGRVPNMLHTAANVAAKLGITREEQDEFALRSQQNCRAAIEAGKFDDEIMPLTVQAKKGP
jgi:acetyl-CoA C-acetyltransferase